MATVAEAYIHGFGPVEEQRLRDQAAVLAPVVFADMDLPVTGRLLELGCGVGAELDLLAARWPGLVLTGIDLSPSHLRAAGRHLDDRATLVRGNAGCLPFVAGSFDVVLTIWMLEHVPDPRAILREALRVLKPTGRLICTEVDNATFRFDPEMPAIHTWWERFCRQQQAAGGDPYVGPRLTALAQELGWRNIQSQDLPVVSSRLRPDRRQELLAYTADLLVSGASQLLAAGAVDEDLLAALHADFAQVREDASIHFEYHAVRLSCEPP
ncbi:MAG: methyltransferase domain-containing protein [Gammaproteobacteria bacterium]|jgi:ubiquinone/menaquinone biosynthesis C-methylase UbiE|nr:methyltransferase domain-containing protein [Gammaproteobacteria bacterium]